MEGVDEEKIFICGPGGCSSELLDDFPEAKPVGLFFGLLLVKVSRKGLRCVVCGGPMRDVCCKYLV